MFDKGLKYYLILAFFLMLISAGKVLDKIRRKETAGKIGIVSSFIFSLIGGILAGMIADVYIEKVQIQWVFIAGGAWMGEKFLDTIAHVIEEKINKILGGDDGKK